MAPNKVLSIKQSCISQIVLVVGVLQFVLLRS